eukprot:m.480365 g.480365  ORF g.480365 m.480365 type:complete len:1010 (+) comp21809_c0_seq1:681-3710(+)
MASDGGGGTPLPKPRPRPRPRPRRAFAGTTTTTNDAGRADVVDVSDVTSHTDQQAVGSKSQQEQEQQQHANTKAREKPRLPPPLSTAARQKLSEPSSPKGRLRPRREAPRPGDALQGGPPSPTAPHANPRPRTASGDIPTPPGRRRHSSASGSLGRGSSSNNSDSSKGNDGDALAGAATTASPLPRTRVGSAGDPPKPRPRRSFGSSATAPASRPPLPSTRPAPPSPRGTAAPTQLPPSPAPEAQAEAGVDPPVLATSALLRVAGKDALPQASPAPASPNPRPRQRRRQFKQAPAAAQPDTGKVTLAGDSDCGGDGGGDGGLNAASSTDATDQVDETSSPDFDVEHGSDPHAPPAPKRLPPPVRPPPPRSRTSLSDRPAPVPPPVPGRSPARAVSIRPKPLGGNGDNNTRNANGDNDEEDPIYDSFSSDEDDDTADSQDGQQYSKRYKIVAEILSTERTYVQSLTLIGIFHQRLKGSGAKAVVPPEVLSTIFSNSKELKSLHCDLLKQLQDLVEDWEESDGIGPTFARLAPVLKIYTTYTTNFDEANDKLDEWTKKSPAFASALANIAQSLPESNGLNLGSFLLEPVQRIPRYKLLIQEYLKVTDEDHSDYPAAKEALQRIADTAAHINESIRHKENSVKMLEIQAMMPAVNLLKPGRHLVHRGQLQKMCRKGLQPREIFLFSDILVYAQEQNKINGQYLSPRSLPLHEMRVSDKEYPDVEFPIQINSISQKSFLLAAASESERQKWKQKIQGAIKTHVDKRSQRLDTHRFSSSMSEFGVMAPVWIPDSSVTMCQNCTLEFTVLRRRHHCRGCGKIVCAACSGQSVPLAYLNDKEGRVCPTCFDVSTASLGVVADSLTLQRQKTRRDKAENRRASARSAMPGHLIAAEGTSIKWGFMFSRGVLAWKRRWFVLKTDFVLYEYKAPEDIVAKNTVPLPGNTVMLPEKSDHVDREFAFKIQHKGANRKIVFAAESADQQEQWIRACDLASKAQFDDDMLPMSVLEEDDELPK